MEQEVLIIFGVVWLICLICYSIALVKSNRDEMVLTATVWDKVLLFACPISIFIAWCIGFEQIDTPQLVLLIIAGCCFAGTAIYSIVYNEGVMRKILSIVAKIFIVWLTLFLILLALCVLIISIILTFMRERDDEDEYILLKYDRVLNAYIGYKVRY